MVWSVDTLVKDVCTLVFVGFLGLSNGLGLVNQKIQEVLESFKSILVLFTSSDERCWL